MKTLEHFSLCDCHTSTLRARFANPFPLALAEASSSLLQCVDKEWHAAIVEVTRRAELVEVFGEFCSHLSKVEGIKELLRRLFTLLARSSGRQLFSVDLLVC